MSRPRVSVVIVNYNYARFLPEAVESVLAQNYDNCEILVVDDGSTDDSHSILKRYEQRVRLVFQENRGVSAARNRGIAESTAPLVAFLDSDDLWHPDKLVRQIERFHDASVGMVYTGLCYIDVDGNALGTMLDGSRGQVLEDIALLRSPGVPASGSSAMVRRSVLDNVGPFDESLSTSADWDMWRRIACHTTIDVVSEPLVLYRQHTNAMHTNVETFERDILRAFESMFADPAARAVHPLERRCYGKLYLTLAGSYLRAGNVKKSLGCLASALKAWPPGIAYVAATPLRYLARGAGKLPQTVGRAAHPRTADD